MENKKSSIAVLGALGVIIVTFNVLAFLLANELTSQFWSGYAFITLSWICLAVLSGIIISRRGYSGYNLFLSIPQILIALIYFLFELIAGIAVMTIPDFSLTASIVIQVIILALFLIAEFGVSAYQGVAKRMPEQRHAETSFKSNLSIEMENAINRCKNPVLKQKLIETNELLKYSDPISSSETTIYEDRIIELFSQIKASLYEESKTQATSLCDEIIQLLKQRNTVCAVSKN